MFKRKILLSPIIGLLITVIFYNLFLPVVCFADETEQSGRENVNKTYNHKTSGVIVSMGDSYSAGEGIEPFYGSRYSEGWELQDWLAHRSEGSWGGQLRLPDVGSMSSSKYPENANPHWYFVASSGAVTWDVTGVKKGAEIVGQNKTYIKFDETTGLAIECAETIDPQIDIFNETQRRQIVPDYITITLGGNDLGFVEILKTAAINCIYLDPCSLANQLIEAIDKLSDFEIKDDWFEEVPTRNIDKSKDLQSGDKVRDRIKKIYFKIDEAASIGDDHPCLLVAGYPHLLNDDFFKTKPTVGDVANAFCIFTPLDAQQLNTAVDLYCDVLQRIVGECKEEGLRIEYVDLNEKFNGFDGFNGHEVNTAEPWINGVTFHTSLPSQQELDMGLFSGASLHPNSKGANGYKECFQRKINELEGLTETPSDDPSATEIRIGSEITFGNYAGEDIQWTIMDETKNGYFLLAKNAIETKDFNDTYENTTWEDCSLRKWLNGEFYDSAFTPEEKEMIQLSNVKNPDNPEWFTDGCNDTQDHIFLLSLYEANVLFNNDNERMVPPTGHAYNNAKVVHSGEDIAVLWWLRSPGRYGKCAAYVDNWGRINYEGLAVADGFDGICGVRPAMWIDKSIKATAIVDVDPTSADKATLVRDGDVVIFGQYEQDGNTGNGKEPIEWEILTEKDGKMLLISKYILDCQPYNTESTEVTWETCSLRQWLNNDFYNTAFNESDRKLIETTTLSNPDNPFGGKGGNSTDDKVFCLSMEEVYSYLDILYETDNPYGGDFCFSLDFLREVTQYARDRGVVHREIGAGYFDFTEVPIDESDLVGKDLGNWWLRSPANSNDRACVVFLSGQAGYEIEEFVHVASEGVRPVMWVSSNDVKDPSSENTAPVPDEVKAAYLDVVNNVSYEDFKSEYYGVPSSGKFSYDLVYVDNDDIPELLVCLTVSGGLNGDEVFANLYTIGNDNKAVQLFQRWAADRFDANTVYYPRENMVKEFIRSGASDYFTYIVNIDEKSRQSKFFYYEQIYDVNDSSIVNYYIYDHETYKTVAEITKLEYEALTTCPGDPVPLVAGRTLQEIKDVLK